MEQTPLLPADVTLKNQIRAKKIVDGLNQGKTYTQIAEDLQLSRNTLYAVMNKQEVQELMVAEVTHMETEAQRMIKELDNSNVSSNKRHALSELGKMIRHTKDKLYPTIFRTETINVNLDLTELQQREHRFTQALNQTPPSCREAFWRAYNQLQPT